MNALSSIMAKCEQVLVKALENAGCPIPNNTFRKPMAREMFLHGIIIHLLTHPDPKVHIKTPNILFEVMLEKKSEGNVLKVKKNNFIKEMQREQDYCVLFDDAVGRG